MKSTSASPKTTLTYRSESIIVHLHHLPVGALPLTGTLHELLRVLKVTNGRFAICIESGRYSAGQNGFAPTNVHLDPVRRTSAILLGWDIVEVLLSIIGFAVGPQHLEPGIQERF